MNDPTEDPNTYSDEVREFTINMTQYIVNELLKHGIEAKYQTHDNSPTSMFFTAVSEPCNVRHWARVFTNFVGVGSLEVHLGDPDMISKIVKYLTEPAPRAVGNVYSYANLTETEKWDAVLSVSDNIDPKKCLYKLHLLTPDQIKARYSYDIVAEWKYDKTVLTLINDITTKELFHVPVGIEGNHRLFAHAIMNKPSLWFEILERS